MASLQPLPPEALYTRCTLSHMDFETTAELGNDIEFIGQDRAIAAIELGITIDRQGYNIFALGPSGTGKYTVIQHFVEQQAAQEPPPDDWCYVNNFDQPYMPVALRLPTGMGKQLERDMGRLVEDLRTGLSSAFESEEYTTRRRTLEEEFQERQQGSLKELQDTARERGLALLRTPAGLAFAPLRGGEVIPPEEFQKLPEEEQKRVQGEVEALQEQLQKVLLQVPRWEREYRTRLRELNNEVTALVVNDLLDDLLTKYKELPDVLHYLQAVQQDISDHLDDFLDTGDDKPAQGEAANLPIPETFKKSPALRRYQVNVLVDSSDAQGAPVIYESNPSYLNLVGRVEQMAMMGALITDFTLIKPGVLHRANGGYLILDALKVLSSPYAWEGLKRALQFRQIRIESPVQMLSLTSTVSLEPEPIPLDIKVILMGDRQLYYLLAQADPDFNELFKVAADFDDEFVRDDETTRQYARLIAAIVRRNELLPFDRSAVCRVIEQAARLVEDSERVTAQMQAIVDLLEESDHWARREQAALVTAAHVQQAIDAQIYRSDRVRERMQEQMLRETVLIDTEGAKVGQINGLSVLFLGTFSFGRPSRITATVYMGPGEVVNIEREVEMSGPLHSKGVLILAGFLRSRYAQQRPLSLSASLVFEQSYGGVDGDSASSTELYALLSAIAQVPIRQSFAVTGSVNQFGQVQAIGGVNEKIEGFFDLCKARGLTGDQGVLIPAANVKHLMLRQDVVEAVAAKQFAIYPIRTIDEGIEVLTGMKAGEPNAKGQYPAGTFNRKVADALAVFAEKSKEFAQQEKTPTRRTRHKAHADAGGDGDGRQNRPNRQGAKKGGAR
ncbi:MAG: ATP-dependent protease [Chloroflexi bacterium]|nr:MAG: ATP-dependent protease [Chloroflexota bacterium]